MKIVEMKNRNNEKIFPDFIEQEVSNSKIKVPSSYAVNEIIRNEYILTYLNGNLISNGASWTQRQIPLTTKTNKTNNKITISDGYLLIGDDVSSIEISYAINIDKNNSNSAIYGRLLKNNSTYFQGISTSAIIFDSIGSTIQMDVKKGDKIGLGYVDNIENSNVKFLGTSGTYFETYMYVKILK